MMGKGALERAVGKGSTILFLGLAAVALILLFWARGFRQFVQESFMQRVRTEHYEILWPRGALSQQAIIQLAAHRESLFAELDKKVGQAGQRAAIRVIFEPPASVQSAQEDGPESYSVTGTTVRSALRGSKAELPPAADAEALLRSAWGRPGNPQIARWTANWLVGEWRGAEIGMAAAQVEQKSGHQKLPNMLGAEPRQALSADDRTLLGSAWISEIAEFGGTNAVRKLYSTKMPQPSIDEVAAILNTTPLELERQWQLWMYSYIAGMPPNHGHSSMSMDMPITGNH
jgi:hypothetical protein